MDDPTNNINNKDKDDAGSLTPSSNSSLKSLTKLAESSADFTVRYLSRLPKISRVRACTLFIWSPFDLLLLCTMYNRLYSKGWMRRKIIRIHENLLLHSSCIGLVGFGPHSILIVCSRFERPAKSGSLVEILSQV